MAEPKEVTATKEDVVADADLAKAWDATEVVEETTKKEEKEVEAKTGEKPTDIKAESEVPSGKEATKLSPEEELEAQRERSRLGRQIKGLKDRKEQLKSEIEKMTKPLEVPDVVTSADDVRRVRQADEEAAKKNQEKYEHDYIAMLEKLGSELGSDKADFHSEIVDSMLNDKRFNRKWTESGFGDARVNYAEAKAALVEKRSGTAESKLPKREKSDTSPVQPAASTTRTATKVVTLPALDDATTEYVNYLKKIGNTEEQIAEMLK